ncbi:polyadenylate-specific 3'-exoribonuclease AS [Corynebacterium sphenisci]|uniref:polyadenylate-specific 3'-exoribonuclease AS n=1 Tax=Corynebacterium sphenisci TaxID=191493 RepID=UPI0026DF5DB8|nr:polyadenylate-specific 3'-exoribonuclease AS [Corynebacterium sphenisci]MDO5731677.1 polyadenylate-specific 3'-exoribonuclease AS [Corynebacterium sphenisci]
MRYFYDTEFIEDGRTIDLISIGVVAEDGREFYAVSAEFDERAAGPWVRAHVLGQLPSPGSGLWMPRSRIRDRLMEFLLPAGGGDPELWAWVGAYDHVALAQLWGDMTRLPRRLPRYTRELKQHWEAAGRPRLPAQPSGRHDALADARHNLARFRAIEAHRERARGR